jgi:hypothetical protein
MMSAAKMPKPGVFQRWESPERYYRAGVERDLLGDWVVVQQWGGRHNGLGSHQVVVVATEDEGL